MDHSQAMDVSHSDMDHSEMNHTMLMDHNNMGMHMVSCLHINLLTIATKLQMMRMYFHFTNAIPNFIFESWSVQTTGGQSMLL